MYTSLATEIALVRLALGLSRTAFARFLGVSQPALLALERERAWPAESTVRSYAALVRRGAESLLYAQQVDYAYASLFSHPSAATALLDATMVTVGFGGSGEQQPPKTDVPLDLRAALRWRWPELASGIKPEEAAPLVARAVAGLEPDLAVPAWYFAANYVRQHLNLTVIYGEDLSNVHPCGNNYALAVALARRHGGYIVPSPRNCADLVRLCVSSLTVSPIKGSDALDISFTVPDGAFTVRVP